MFQGAKLDKLDKSQHKLTFADIAGIDNVKAEVQELVEFLKNPKRFLDLGAKSPAGVMLVGSPGTGLFLQLDDVTPRILLCGLPFHIHHFCPLQSSPFDHRIWLELALAALTKNQRWAKVLKIQTKLKI